MSKPALNNCKSHDDIIRASRSLGFEIKNGGCHTKICYQGRYVTAVPRHKGDLAKGTLCAIIKALIKAGIVLTMLGIMAVAAAVAL